MTNDYDRDRARYWITLSPHVCLPMLLLIREPRPFTEALFFELLEQLRSILGKYVSFSDLSNQGTDDESAIKRAIVFCNLDDAFSGLKEVRAGNLWFTYQFRDNQAPHLHVLDKASVIGYLCSVLLVVSPLFREAFRALPRNSNPHHKHKQSITATATTSDSKVSFFNSYEVTKFELVVTVGSLDRTSRQGEVANKISPPHRRYHFICLRLARSPYLSFDSCGYCCHRWTIYNSGDGDDDVDDDGEAYRVTLLQEGIASGVSSCVVVVAFFLRFRAAFSSVPSVASVVDASATGVRESFLCFASSSFGAINRQRRQQWLSVRPGIFAATSIHRLPCSSASFSSRSSSSALHGARMTDGSSTFKNRSRHCISVRSVRTCCFVSF